MTEIYYKRHPEAEAPKLWPDRGGLILRAFAKSNDGHKVKIIIPPHTPKLIRTGITLVPEPGYIPYILTRRENAKQGLQVVHAPIALEPDTEVSFVIHNGSLETQYVEHGDFIAYAILLRGAKLSLTEIL